MGFNCGIIGLPNVGKSTLFNALTNAGVTAENYPFCTIDANKGVVVLPDERLERLKEMVHPEETVPTSIEFVDIAGLVKGAAKGEGLGNQFLGHIKNVDALVHIVRCFEDENVIHVSGEIDPVNDIEVVKAELIFKDMETIERRIEKDHKLMKGQDKHAAAQNELLAKVMAGLNQMKTVREQGLTTDEIKLIADLFLTTTKPYFYVCNCDEGGLTQDPPACQKVEAYAKKENVPVLKICSKLEAEIAELEPAEKKEFLKDYGITQSGLEHVIHTGYELLGLITFFTVVKSKLSAWTIRKGTRAPQAAGVIHSDFEKGFIKAEVFGFEDLLKHGSTAAIHEAGLTRVEGKDYVVSDGDVVNFKFNVS